MKDSATILVHSKQKDPFNRVPKTISDGNTGLSLKASMILVYLIGKPVGWKTRVTDITRRFTDGKFAIRAGLNELRVAGYATLDALRDENGRLCGTIWRISDQPEFRKQKISNSHRDHGFPKLGKTETRKNRNSENQYLSKNHLVPRKNTTKTEAAEAASSDDVDLGKAFLTRWSQSYKEWFKISYLQKSGEAQQARKVIEELQCRPKDLMAYVFRMWINTTDYDEIDSNGHDPLFYQIKGSRNVRFFLKYISEIAAEQKEPLDCAIPVKEGQYQQLEAVVSAGRPT